MNYSWCSGEENMVCPTHINSSAYVILACSIIISYLCLNLNCGNSF